MSTSWRAAFKNTPDGPRNLQQQQPKASAFSHWKFIGELKIQHSSSWSICWQTTNTCSEVNLTLFLRERPRVRTGTALSVTRPRKRDIKSSVMRQLRFKRLKDFLWETARVPTRQEEIIMKFKCTQGYVNVWSPFLVKGFVSTHRLYVDVGVNKQWCNNNSLRQIKSAVGHGSLSITESQ